MTTTPTYNGAYLASPNEPTTLEAAILAQLRKAMNRAASTDRPYCITVRGVGNKAEIFIGYPGGKIDSTG